MSIGILLSSYNGEMYIEEQLVSIKNQTIEPDNVVIIDDCSTDNTVDICKSFILRNRLTKKWKVIKNEGNLGWIVNFSRALDYLKNDYIFYCDQDDIWLENKIKDTMNVFYDFPNVDVVGTLETLWYNDGRKEVLGIEDGSVEILRLKDSRENFKIGCSGCTMALKRTFLKYIRPYHIKYWAHDDFAWKTSLAMQSGALLHKSTILHRIHGKNESRKPNRNKDDRILGIKEGLEIYSVLRLFVEECCQNIDYKKKMLDCVDYYYHGLQNRINLLENKSIKSVMRLLFKYKTAYRTYHEFFGDIYLAYLKK